MKRLPSFLAGAALAALATYAYGQAIGSRTLTGNEAIVAAQGGPGGTSMFVTASQMRNSTGVTTTTTVTGTFPLTTATSSLVSTVAATGAMVVQLPPSPYDGQIFEWVNGAAGPFTTGNTVATTDGSTIQGANTTGALAAAASIEFRYALSTNTWYKVR
jgi:hypothetical protein